MSSTASSNPETDRDNSIAPTSRKADHTDCHATRGPRGPGLVDKVRCCKFLLQKGYKPGGGSATPSRRSSTSLGCGTSPKTVCTGGDAVWWLSAMIRQKRANLGEALTAERTSSSQCVAGRP